MNAAANEFDQRFKQACSGALSWPEFAGALFESKVCVLVDRDYGSNYAGVMQPMMVRNGDGLKLLAVFTSYDRAWEWRDPKFTWAVELDARQFLTGNTAIAINPGSDVGIEMDQPVVARLRDGQRPQASEIRLRRSSLAPPRA